MNPPDVDHTLVVSLVIRYDIKLCKRVEPNYRPPRGVQSEQGDRIEDTPQNSLPPSTLSKSDMHRRPANQIVKQFEKNSKKKKKPQNKRTIKPMEASAPQPPPRRPPAAAASAARSDAPSAFRPAESSPRAVEPPARPMRPSRPTWNGTAP